MKYEFKIGEKYRRRDIYRIIGIPENTKGGNWDTGYNKYRGDWFIFVNVETPGRTGHDYNNKFIGDDLLWRGKTGSHHNQSSIQSMLNQMGDIYIFYRTNNGHPFIFNGLGKVKEYRKTMPIEVIWTFKDINQVRAEVLPEEVLAEEGIYEGMKKRITVNIHERNPIARQMCIEHYGTCCSICGFDFGKVYGKLGAGYIHVHHLIPLKEVDEEYQIDPVCDLRPICPNCHAMIHRRNPPYTIEEILGYLNLLFSSSS